MKINIKSEGKEIEINSDKKDTVRDVLRKAGIEPETVLVKHNDKIVPLEDSPKEKLETIRIISGG